MIQKRSLHDFFNRLEREEDFEDPTPITWLIGAGFSVSSGIPLAKEVSQMIVLFEYIAEIKEYRPWHSESKRKLNYKNDIDDYFEWYSNESKNKGEEFNNFLDESLVWHSEKVKFTNLSIGNPEYYQELFRTYLNNPTVYTLFLTKLISRAKGVNLAHLGLAGILRDYPKWGNTVYTTNFDDLLLKALLILNHNARVFGEFKSKDKPELNPNYPQIVHLHGKHTGNSLLNTDEQIGKIDPDLQEGFKRHMANSHIVVVGYSGWNDLIMKTLEGWKNTENLVKGNVYWVPYRDESTILPEVLNFLNECPPNRVFVIENEEKTLDADLFMMSVSNFFNKENEGFTPYRKGIINFSITQHDFILTQLKQYPNFNPERSMSIVEKIISNLADYKNDIPELEKKINEAKEIVLQPDIPLDLRARTLAKTGRIYNKINMFRKAIADLNIARNILSTNFLQTVENKKNIARYDLELSELYLKIGDFESSYNFGGNLYHLNNIQKIDTPVLYTKSRIIYALRSLALGEIEKALLIVKDIDIDIFLDAPIIEGNYRYASGLVSFFKTQYGHAKRELNKALEVFESLKADISAGNVLIYLAKIDLRSMEYSEAEEKLNRCQDIFIAQNDEIGLGNTYIGFAEKFKQTGDNENATLWYKKGLETFISLDLYHNIGNVTCDLLLTYKEIGNETAYQELFTYFNKNKDRFNNKYVQHRLNDINSKTPHGEEE